jgi:hypothetical protein
MSLLTFTITLNAPVEKIRTLMFNHPTYEMRTKAFAENSTYEWDRQQGSDITFGDGSWTNGMVAHVAVNQLHEFLSLKHIGQLDAENKLELHPNEAYENYRFTKIDENTTKLDVELTGLPEEYLPMFKDMRPRALDLLKTLCE